MKFIIPFSYLYFESVYRQNQTKTEPSFHFHGESVVKCIYKWTGPRKHLDIGTVWELHISSYYGLLISNLKARDEW